MFKDHKPLDVPKDHFLLLPPFVSVWRRSPSSLLRLWFCHFSFVPIPNAVYPCVRSDCMENEERVMIPLIFSKSDAPNVWLAYQDLINLPPIRSEGPKWRITSAVLRLVMELAAFAMQPRDSNASDTFVDPTMGLDHRLEELCRRIIDNPGYPWKAGELAKSVGLSAGHLYAIFQSGLGTSPKQYILQTRFRLALKLLNPSVGGHKSIKEISAACGFSSQELFARQFKKFFGIAPSEYRQHPKTLMGTTRISRLP